MNTSAEIKNKRLGMGLTQAEFAQLLGLGQSGERTIRGWENNEHFPTEAKLAEIRNLPSSAPLKNTARKHLFTFIDLLYKLPKYKSVIFDCISFIFISVLLS